MSIKERDFHELRREILVLLREIKGHSIFEEEDWTKFLSGVLMYPIECKKEWMAEEILKYQYSLHDSYKQNLYKMLHGASDDSIAKLAFVYPREVIAFKKYGREDVGTLKKIVAK